MNSLLLLDDDDVFRVRMAKSLQKRGYEVVQAASLSESLGLLDGRVFDFAIVDLFVPDGSGIDLLKALKEKCPEVQAVVLTGYGTISSAVEAVKLGALEYLTKPTNIEDVVAVLNRQQTAIRCQPQPTLAQVEWEHMQRVLNDHQGNVTKAAEALGLHRRSLQRKLSKRPDKLQ